MKIREKSNVSISSSSIFHLVEIPEDLLEAINDKQIQNLVNSIEKHGGGPRCHHVTHDVPDSEDSDSKNSDDEPKSSKLTMESPVCIYLSTLDSFNCC